MDVATVDCATLNPSLSSSPWMRGAPSAGSARAAPSRFAGALPASSISNTNSGESRPDATAPASLVGQASRPSRSSATIDTSRRPAAGICEPSPALQLTTQDDQLMSENRILRLKPTLRLEWRGRHRKNEPYPPDHRTNYFHSIFPEARA